MNNTAKLGLLLPAVLNPATAAVIGIGLIAVGIYRLLEDDDEEEACNKRPTNGVKAADPIVTKPSPTVNLDDAAGQGVANLAAPAPITEADQKEMIRNAMSELGKRSAAARAKKKAERQELGS